jgi:hypothetical protein
MLYVGGAGSLLMFAFTLYCVLDVILSEAVLVRNLPKLTWLLLVLFVPLIGGIAWLVAGRPETAGAAPGSHISRGRPPGYRYSTRGNPVRPPTGRSDVPGPRDRRALPPAPQGPDDDPEFLRDIAERLRRPDEEA